jgi:hypothetical protein
VSDTGLSDQLAFKHRCVRFTTKVGEDRCAHVSDTTTPAFTFRQAAYSLPPLRHRFLRSPHGAILANFLDEPSQTGEQTGGQINLLKIIS